MPIKVGASIGTYEAKSHFSELLDRVAKGEVITITRRGEPVAKLGPPARSTALTESGIDEAYEKFAREHPASLGGLSIKDLINEGRKY